MCRKKVWMVLSCLLCLLCFPNCGSGEKTIQQVAPDSIPAKVTFSQHILPIMKLYCVSCHRDSNAPSNGCDEDAMNYSTYAGTRACFGDMLESVMQKGDMPPGAAPRLTTWEKMLLLQWREGGFQR